MSASIEPRHTSRDQCVNAICGCDDLVSAGTCSEWCAAHTVEAADLERGMKPASEDCCCGHGCVSKASGGTPERGQT